MEKLFDLSEFDSYKEDNRREVKSAKMVYQTLFGKRILLFQMDMVELLF